MLKDDEEIEADDGLDYDPADDDVREELNEDWARNEEEEPENTTQHLLEELHQCEQDDSAQLASRSSNITYSLCRPQRSPLGFRPEVSLSPTCVSGIVAAGPRSGHEPDDSENFSKCFDFHHQSFVIHVQPGQPFVGPGKNHTYFA